MGSASSLKRAWINSVKIMMSQIHVIMLAAVLILVIWKYSYQGIVYATESQEKLGLTDDINSLAEIDKHKSEGSGGELDLTSGSTEELGDTSKQEYQEPRGAMSAASIEPAKSCSPHHHIMFLKTHKCASSTVQNIFLRYGYQHKLTFALGTGSSHILGYHPDKFTYAMLNQALLPGSGRADIWTLHTRLNIPEHQKAVHPDAKWITIVRDPVEQFGSLFAYYEFEKEYKMDFETYLKRPVEILRKVPRWKGKHGKNTMLFDMGYPDSLPSEQLDGVIQQMDHLFHYVMISERMDESLILLKNKLCWTNDDIIGFTKNARVDGNNKLPKELSDKITQMNMEDTAIYKHFLNKHKKAVEKFGIEKMGSEVIELQKLRQEYNDNCVAEEVLGHDKRLGKKEWRGNVNAFIPADNGNETCRLITMAETAFVRLVMKRQKNLIKNT